MYPEIKPEKYRKNRKIRHLTGPSIIINMKSQMIWKWSYSKPTCRAPNPYRSTHGTWPPSWPCPRRTSHAPGTQSTWADRGSATGWRAGGSPPGNVRAGSWHSPRSDVCGIETVTFGYKQKMGEEKRSHVATLMC